MKPKFNTAKFRSQTLGASLVTSIVVCLSGAAFAADWAGNVSGDWNDNNNWVGGAGTGESNAIINLVGSNVSAPYTATINGNLVATPVDIIVGQGGGNTGLLNHISGNASTGGGNWIYVGIDTGTGTFNLADTNGTGGTFTGFGQGSGNMTVNGGRLNVGGNQHNASGGTGTVNVNTTGTLAISSDLQVGVKGGTGTMNVDSATITTGGWNFIGKNDNGVAGANGTLRMSGGILTNTGITYVGQQGCTGTMILSGGTYKHKNNEVFMVGGTIDWADWFGTTGGTGFLTVDHSASLLDCPGEFWIGNRGGNGTMTLSAGSVITNNWTVIGRGGNGGGGVTQGTVNMRGGSFTKNGGGNFIVGDNATGVLKITGGALSANGEFWVGQAGSGNGTMELSDTAAAATVATNGWMVVGRENGTGAVTMTGGTWTHSGNTQFIIGSTGPGTMTMSSGLVDILSGYTWVGERVESTTASLTISGTAEFRSRLISVGPESPNATLNLDGGIVRTHKFMGSRNENDGEDYGTGTINFNGSQIIATAADLAFIAATVDNAVIGAGDLLINSNGFNLVVPKALSGVGDVVKSGAGKLTLSALNAYTGNNRVDGGELVLMAGPSGNGGVSLADGTALGVSQAIAGSQLVSANVTFGTTSAGTTLNLNLGDAGGTNPGNSILDVTGNLVLNGNVTVNVAGSKFDDAIMPLVSYNSANRSGAGVFVLDDLPNGVVATLVDNPNYGGPGAGLLYLNITSVALPEWDGTNAPKYVKTGDVTNGAFDVIVTDATGIAIGQKAFGPGIPAGATVTVVSGLTITLSQAATADAFSVPVRFTVGSGTNDGVWDIATTQNWVDQVTTLNSGFADANPVLFSDIATGPTAVILNSTVRPSEVVFNNSTLPYSLAGTGKISDLGGGATTLTKAGSQGLAITTINDYTGATTLAGGTTTVASLTDGGVASPLGAATAAAANLALSGGTLDYTGATVSIDRGFTTGGLDGAISVPGGSDLTMTGQVTGGLLSSFNKKGGGSLILTNPSVTLGASGQVNEVLAGTLRFSGPGQTVAIPGELWVGSAPAAAGQLVLDNTSLNVGGWLTLGRGNGNTGLLSTITASNSALVCGNFSAGYDNFLPNDSDQTVTLTNSTFTSNGQTLLAEKDNATTVLNIDANSSFTANGRFLTALGNGSVCSVTVRGTLNHVNEWLSIGNSANGSGTMTVTDNGLVESNNDFNIGDVDSSNGTLNIEVNGKVNSTGPVFIGKNGTTGQLNMSGASTMTSANTNVADNAGSNGALKITGTSVYTSNGRLQVGPGGGSTGSVLIEGFGSMAVNSYVSVGFDGGGSMTVRDNGLFSNTDDFSVNENGDVPAMVTLQDNAKMSVTRTVFVGRNTGRVGTLSVSGAASLNQTDADYSFIVGPAGTGTLNIGGTAAVSTAAASGLVLTNNATGTATVNLNGGTLSARKVSDGGGASTFNFNGGVLQAGTGADVNFMTGVDAVNVSPGGAFIDSNGQTIALNQVLSNGGGSLTKQGAGTLLLNGANSYLGATTVAAGTLGGTGSVGGALIVPSGSSIAPGAAGVGTFSVGDTLAIGTTIDGTYVCEIAGTAADKLVIGDVLDITGATLNFSVLSAPTAVSYVIATYASRNGTFIEQNVPEGFQVVYGATSITLELIPTPFNTWAISHGLNPLTDGAPGVDKDGDGQSNGLEFALGGSPVSGSDNARIYSLVADGSADPDATDELLMTIAVRGGTPEFAGSPAPSAIKDGVTYSVQGSMTLDAFVTAVKPVNPVVTGLPAAPAGYEYRTFSLEGSNGTPTRGFLRVVVNF